MKWGGSCWGRISRSWRSLGRSDGEKRAHRPVVTLKVTLLEENRVAPISPVEPPGQAQGSTAVVLRSFDSACGLAQDRGERPKGVEPRLASLAQDDPSTHLERHPESLNFARDSALSGGRRAERGAPGQSLDSARDSFDIRPRDPEPVEGGRGPSRGVVDRGRAPPYDGGAR